MGLQCRIIRESDGTLSVYDTRGNISTLYNNLVQYFQRGERNAPLNSSELATQERDIHSRERFMGRLMLAPNGEVTNLSEDQWTLTRTPLFQEVYGNWINGTTNLLLDENGEPVFSDSSTSIEGLSEQEVRQQLSTSSQSEGAEQRALLLWGLSNTQEFKERTGLTEEPGIEMLIDYYERYGSGIPLGGTNTNDLRAVSIGANLTTAQLIYDGATEADPNPVIKNYSSTFDKPNFIPEDKSPVFDRILYPKGDTTVLGSPIQYTTTDLLEVLDRAYLDNVFDESDIRDLTDNLPIPIAERILSDTTLQRELFLMYRQVESTGHYTYVNGELTPIVDAKYRTTVNNTLIQNRDNTNLLQNLRILTTVNEQTFNRERETVRDLLKSVERDAANINLDVIGLSSIYLTKAHTDVVSYLNTLGNLVEMIQAEVATTDDINRFVDSHNEFFGISEQQRTSAVRNRNEYPMVIIEGNINATEAFETQNLIHLYDNVWVKVDTANTLSQLMSSVRPELPSYIYEGVELGSEELRNRIINFFDRQVSIDYSFSNSASRPMYNMARYLYSQTYSNPVAEVQQEVSQLYDVSRAGNADYLMTSFVPDFYNYILQEKLKNSMIYDRLLKYFYVNDAGLQLDGNPQSVYSELMNFESQIPNVGDLYNYAAISGNQSLLDILRVEPSMTLNPGELLQTSVLNPETINEYPGQYSEIRDGRIKANEYVDDVIKIEGRLYKIDDYNEITYSPYLESDILFTTQINSVTALPITEHTQRITQNQRQGIQQRIDNC